MPLDTHSGSSDSCRRQLSNGTTHLPLDVVGVAQSGSACGVCILVSVITIKYSLYSNGGAVRLAQVCVRTVSSIARRWDHKHGGRRRRRHAALTCMLCTRIDVECRRVPRTTHASARSVGLVDGYTAIPHAARVVPSTTHSSASHTL